MPTFDKLNIEDLASEDDYESTHCEEDDASHALAYCLNCRLTCPSADAKVILNDGGVEWECPLCGSDDCDVFNPEYADYEEDTY